MEKVRGDEGHEFEIIEEMKRTIRKEYDKRKENRRK